MILVGTSGYNYPEWKGSFYPPDLPAAKMLPYYADRFSTVEINYTFYRMPTAEAGHRLGGAGSRSTFRFTLKAPKRITHDRRLRDVADPVRGVLRGGRGARAASWARCCFSCRRTSRKISRSSTTFSASLPPRVCARVRVPPRVVAGRGGVRAAARAQPGAVHRRQRETIDAGRDDRRLRLPAAARRGLHGGATSRAGPTRSRDLATRCKDVFVYFKHEDEGKGAAFGQMMMRRGVGADDASDEPMHEAAQRVLRHVTLRTTIICSAQ